MIDQEEAIAETEFGGGHGGAVIYKEKDCGMFDDEVNSFGSDEDYTAEERKAMEAFYEESIKNFKKGQIVTGNIVRVDKESVLIDVGFKSEGSVSLYEFPQNGKDLEVGDTIEVFLEQTEDKNGLIVLSKEKANKIKVWDEITKAYDTGTTIEGIITSKTKGGLTVDIGLKAFLPGSHVDIRPVRNMDKMVGQKFNMKVIKMDKKRGNIVLSRKILLEEERKESKEELLKSLDVGKTFEGIVKNITDYGAFIDLGGIDGLLHIIDMSWGRINHPSELFAVGDKVKVIVLKYVDGKVSLGYKQTTEDPWNKIIEKYSVDSKVRGKVVNIADYGAFIELEEGVEGLVHISEMSWNKYLRHPSKIVAIGDMVDALVLSIDKDKRRISLGMKQLESNPWSNIDEKYPIGSQVEGCVRNITNFGAFIELEEGVDGLIHISDLSWTQKVRHPSEVLKKRDRVKAIVLNVDKDNERLSLGLKQLDDDPWLTVPDKYILGQEVKGKIVKITNFGAFAELEDGIEGLIHLSQLASKKVTNPEDEVSVGEEITAKVIKVNAEERKLGLSIKAQIENLDVSEIVQELSSQEGSSESSEENTEAPKKEDTTSSEEKTSSDE